MRTVEHWISGRSTAGAATRHGPVWNPATGEQQAQVVLATVQGPNTPTSRPAARHCPEDGEDAKAAAGEDRDDDEDEGWDEEQACEEKEERKGCADQEQRSEQETPTTTPPTTATAATGAPPPPGDPGSRGEVLGS